MAQRQFRSDDTSPWVYKFGSGSDGAYAPSTGTDTVIDSACTGTSGGYSLSATNGSFAPGQLLLIHQTYGSGAGQWELNKIQSYTAGTITTVYPLTQNYVTGAQVAVILQYVSGNIAGGVTISGKPWNGTVGGIYAKICNGTFTVAGALTLSDLGFRGGAQIGVGQAPAQAGDGTVGLVVSQYGANGNGGGGGQGEWDSQSWGGGAGGGNGTAGDDANAHNSGTHGTHGNSVGSVNLVTADFGGGGGGGYAAGSGGNGGGFFLIIAKNIITTGTLPNDGGAGVSGTGPSGGGAGGSTLLKGMTLALGSNLVTASSGPRGSDAGYGTVGGAGGVGRIHADYSVSCTGTTSPALDSTLDPTIMALTGAGLIGSAVNI